MKKIRRTLKEIEADLHRSEQAGGNESELRYLRSAVRSLAELVEQVAERQ